MVSWTRNLDSFQVLTVCKVRKWKYRACPADPTQRRLYRLGPPGRAYFWIFPTSFTFRIEKEFRFLVSNTKVMLMIKLNKDLVAFIFDCIVFFFPCDFLLIHEISTGRIWGCSPRYRECQRHKPRQPQRRPSHPV